MANSTGGDTRERYVYVAVFGMATFFDTVKNDLGMIDCGKTAAVKASQFNSCIFQWKNQALEIKHDSLEQLSVDFRFEPPIVVVPHV